MDYNGNVGLDRCIRGLKFNFFCVDNGGFVGLVRCIRGLKLIFFFFVDNGGFLPLLFSENWKNNR